MYSRARALGLDGPPVPSPSVPPGVLEVHRPGSLPTDPQQPLVHNWVREPVQTPGGYTELGAILPKLQPMPGGPYQCRGLCELTADSPVQIVHRGPFFQQGVERAMVLHQTGRQPFPEGVAELLPASCEGQERRPREGWPEDCRDSGGAG
ncbi:unnamed protein product [Cuscuta europaea]|uniref:Uncharacterized protein n=1 Tax=Cuscuta europaea TaxID=41803 RepID=A0A9P1DXR2_CUSEU|nr:unnamed protein product [Cuscuta europaea]